MLVGQDPTLGLSFFVCKVSKSIVGVRLGRAKLIPVNLHHPQPCCNWDAKKGEYVFPAKKQLQGYRVLITTLITASRWGECVCLCISKGVRG
jgi:hypothetical protein